MKKSILLLMTLAVSCLYAQNGITNDKRFGSEADSTRCHENIFLVSQAVKGKSPSYAGCLENYPRWKELFTEFPVARVDTYTNGAKLLKVLIAKETDPEKKAAYINDLMALYDQEMKYIDRLQEIYPKPLLLGEILGKKAMDYVNIVPNANPDSAYAMLAKSVELEKGRSDFRVTEQFMKQSALKYKRNKESHGDQVIDDYLNASVYIVDVLDKYNEKIEEFTKKYQESGDPRDSTQAAAYGTYIDYSRIARNNIDAYFINCGAAKCDDLNSIYITKIEENKDNIEYLNKVISIMDMLKCTKQEAYLMASEYALAIEPTSRAAMGCGYRYFAKGQSENSKELTDKALELFDQAIELETSVTTKAELCNKVGYIYFSMHKYSKAREYARKAIALNSKFGQPYILIAQCYAQHPNWCEDGTMNRCTYYLAIDKLRRAKAIDPSVKKEADKLIATYNNPKYLPEFSDIFMKGYKSGSKVTIGGWINETTTIP